MRRLFHSAGLILVEAQLFVGLCMAQTSVGCPHCERARQLIGEGRTDAAIAEYEEAVKTEPNNAEAQGNLGVLQFFANDCSKALPHLIAAYALQPSEARVQALVGICQKREGQVEDAERNLNAALPSVSNPRIHILILKNLVDIEYARGDLQDASENISALMGSDALNSDVLYLAFRIYTDLADLARDELAVAAPDSARMHLLTAERFVKAGDASSAIRQYREALAKDPSLSGVHFELGEAMLKESLGEDSLNSATSELQLALKEDPRNAAAEGKLGVIEGFRGHFNLAEEHYRRALNLKADEVDALVGLADILRERGDYQKAAEYLSRASTVDPLDSSIHYRLAQLYRKLDRKRTQITKWHYLSRFAT